MPIIPFPGFGEGTNEYDAWKKIKSIINPYNSYWYRNRQLRNLVSILSGIENKLTSLSKDITKLSDRIDNNNIRISDLRTSVSDVRNRLSAIDSDLQNVKERIRSIGGDITTLKSNYSDLSKKVKNLSSLYSQLNDKLKKMDGRVGDIEKKIKAMRSRLNEVYSISTQNQDRLDDIGQDVQYMRRQISDINSTIKSIKTNISDISDRVENLRGRVSKLEKTISEFTKKVNTHDLSIRNISQDVDNVWEYTDCINNLANSSKKTMSILSKSKSTYAGIMSNIDKNKVPELSLDGTYLAKIFRDMSNEIRNTLNGLHISFSANDIRTIVTKATGMLQIKSYVDNIKNYFNALVTNSDKMVKNASSRYTEISNVVNKYIAKGKKDSLLKFKKLNIVNNMDLNPRSFFNSTIANSIFNNVGLQFTSNKAYVKVYIKDGSWNKTWVTNQSGVPLLTLYYYINSAIYDRANAIMDYGDSWKEVNFMYYYARQVFIISQLIASYMCLVQKILNRNYDYQTDGKDYYKCTRSKKTPDGKEAKIEVIVGNVQARWIDREIRKMFYALQNDIYSKIITPYNTYLIDNVVTPFISSTKLLSDNISDVFSKFKENFNYIHNQFDYISNTIDNHAKKNYVSDYNPQVKQYHNFTFGYTDEYIKNSVKLLNSDKLMDYEQKDAQNLKDLVNELYGKVVELENELKKIKECQRQR